jgi:hypothetical protein
LNGETVPHFVWLADINKVSGDIQWG